jgi:hypothetical protein
MMIQPIVENTSSARRSTSELSIGLKKKNSGNVAIVNQNTNMIIAPSSVVKFS